MLAESVQPVYASGACEIDVARRELRVLGTSVPVGGRAFEIIEVLAQSHGELVTKDELIHRIWPGAIVMDSTLHVHAAALRKALGPYRDLLKTESRRGYRLLGNWTVRQRAAKLPAIAVAPMRTAGQSAAANRPAANLPAANLPAANPLAANLPATNLPATNLPATLAHLIGRAAAAQRVHNLVSAHRLVTLTGPGGIGKTTLAVKVARRLLGDFPDGVWLVELASLSDPQLVPSAIAGVLGLRLGPDINSTEAIARAIGGRKLLLILDNCEHVIDPAAGMAETLVRLCPHATILATSRELLRIDGECAYRVPPLDVPPKTQTQPDQILAHSAPALFVAKVVQFDSDLAPEADELPIIAAICQQLDGIPLAIEFAAARAATLGVRQVAAGLRDRFTLLKHARRTALPRQQTLRATLDWSYELLPGPERVLLQRLAVFSGNFSFDAVRAVAGSDITSDGDLADGLVDLVSKSLLTSDRAAGGGYFRWLETTRAYAFAKLSESGDLAAFSRRHAIYCKGLLERVAGQQDNTSMRAADLDNIRTALEWCFGEGGDVAIGVALAAAAAPVLLAMSLLPECHRWSERALGALDATGLGGAWEMNLQMSLGVSSMQINGPSDAARAALSRSLAIAEARGDVLNQVGLLGMLSMFEVRDGEFATSLHYARLGSAVEGVAENPAARALAGSGLGRGLQFVGEHCASRRGLEESFQYWSRSGQASQVYLGLDHRILVGTGLARSLWFRGYPAQAAERLRQTIADAERMNHPASLGLALSWAPGLFLWIGDPAKAAQYTDWLSVHAEAHSLRPYLAVARGYRGALAVGGGDAGAGVADLLSSLAQLHALRYRMLGTGFKLSIVQGLAALQRFGEAVACVDETIGLIEAKGDLVHMPEALRIRGNVFLAMPKPREDDAETCFMQSLGWSTRQGARSWQLRTAVDLATLWSRQGRRVCARAVLEPVFVLFEEGLDTADVQAAQRLLATLR